MDKVLDWDSNDKETSRNYYWKQEVILKPAGPSPPPFCVSSTTFLTTMSDGRIYVGNLPMDVQERDIEDLFYKYGKIREIELKNNRGTIPFAFIRFEDPRWVLGMISGTSIHFTPCWIP